MFHIVHTFVASHRLLLGILLSALACLFLLSALRHRLQKHVAAHITVLRGQLASVERRFHTVSQLGFKYMLSLSKESVQALAEAEQILSAVHESLESAEDLAHSSDSEDWREAEAILNQGILQPSATATISGFQSSGRWNERVDALLEQVGTEVFVVSRSYCNSFRSLREQFPATVKALVESGIRCAVKHVQMEKARIPYRRRLATNK